MRCVMSRNGRLHPILNHFVPFRTTAPSPTRRAPVRWFWGRVEPTLSLCHGSRPPVPRSESNGTFMRRSATLPAGMRSSSVSQSRTSVTFQLQNHSRWYARWHSTRGLYWLCVVTQHPPKWLYAGDQVVFFVCNACATFSESFLFSSP